MGKPVLGVPTQNSAQTRRTDVVTAIVIRMVSECRRRNMENIIIIVIVVIAISGGAVSSVRHFK